jgi:hypothetical protein
MADSRSGRAKRDPWRFTWPRAILIIAAGLAEAAVLIATNSWLWVWLPAVVVFGISLWLRRVDRAA